MRNLRRGGRPSPKLGNASKRMTNKGTPIWYVFVDESGRPVYTKQGHQFIMDALVTDDPELLATIVTSKAPVPADWTAGDPIPAPGSREMKHSELARSPIEAVLGDLERCDVKAFGSVAVKQKTGKSSNGRREYMQRLADLAELIVNEGPAGLYRFRIDDSPFYDQEEVYRILRSKFRYAKDKELTDMIALKPVDSDLTPALQAADILVSEHGCRAQHGVKAEREFENRYLEKTSYHKVYSGKENRKKDARESQEEPGLPHVVSESRKNRWFSRTSRRYPTPTGRKSSPSSNGLDHTRESHSGVTGRITAPRLKKNCNRLI